MFSLEKLCTLPKDEQKCNDSDGITVGNNARVSSGRGGGSIATDTAPSDAALTDSPFFEDVRRNNHFDARVICHDHSSCSVYHRRSAFVCLGAGLASC
jgi:hypothetical protein